MKGRALASTMMVLLMLGGCVTPSIQSAETTSFEGLARQIKYEIGTYQFRHQDDKAVVAPPVLSTNPEEGTPAERAAVFQQEQQAFAANVAEGGTRAATSAEKCLGQVSFTITKVKVTVTNTIGTKNSASVGLDVPVGIVTLSPKVSGSNDTTQSIATTFEIYPNEQRLTAPPAPVANFQGTPIADTLERLAADLVKTADAEPCFNFGKTDDQKSNTVKLGFTLVKVRGGGGTVKIVVFSLGAEGSSTKAVANTIEVSFTAQGGFG